MKNYFYMFIFLFLLGFFGGCAFSGGINNDSQRVIKIAYLPITHSVAVMMLEDTINNGGDYAIELIRFTSWPEVVEALRSKKVDGASILFEVALRARETDDNLVMLSLSHRDGNVIVVDNHIKDYHDLIDKTLAIPHKLSPQNTLLRRLLEREGIAPDAINIIEISPAEMPFSMAAGSISAYIVAEPWGTIAEANKAGRILETSDQICPDSVCCVLVFNRDVLEENPVLKDTIAEGMEKAAALAQEKDDWVVNVFKNHSSFSEQVIRQSLMKTNYDNLYLCEDEYTIITETILRYNVLQSVPAYREFVYE